MRAKPKGAKYRNLTEPDLDEIERMARENKSETYRGPLLGLVDEVRRLRQNQFKRVSCPTCVTARWVGSE